MTLVRRNVAFVALLPRQIAGRNRNEKKLLDTDLLLADHLEQISARDPTRAARRHDCVLDCAFPGRLGICMKRFAWTAGGRG